MRAVKSVFVVILFEASIISSAGGVISESHSIVLSNFTNIDLDLLENNSAFHSLKLESTTVVVAHEATTDGSAISTHNVDCVKCDFRIAKTQSKEYPIGSMKSILKFKPDYPHFVTNDRSSVWSPESLDRHLPQHHYWSSREYIENQTLGYIPEVIKTYAMVEGLFGIMNEVGVGVGKSTCSSIWYGKPPRACPECEGPQIEISMLTIIALERCATARCAIELIGGLAQSLGYYAAEPTESEGGEGLTVIDNTEAWVFHILPDESGDGVVWVAQRVPDTHVAAIANAFIIREVDPERHSVDFLYSSNLWSEAERAGLWNQKEGKLLNFAKVFGPAPSVYSTRRQWRVLDMVAPSLNLSCEVDWTQVGLPFSVEVDKKITVRDVMAIKRDFYEGTKFDLSQGTAAGPFGNPQRLHELTLFAGKYHDIKLAHEEHGGFERAISLTKTSYSSISVSFRTTNSQDHLHGIVWVAQYAPHLSVYVPIFVGAGDAAVPKPLSTGSLWRADKESAFWKACAVGNWAAQFFKYAIVDVRDVQKRLEDETFEHLETVISEARQFMSTGNRLDANTLLADYSNECCNKFIYSYDQLFMFLMTKYHDGYMIESPLSNSDTMIHAHPLFYSKWWLKVVTVFWTTKKDSDGSSQQTTNVHVDAIDGDDMFDTVADNLQGSTSFSADRSQLRNKIETSQTAVKSIVSLLVYFITLLMGVIFGILGERWASSRLLWRQSQQTHIQQTKKEYTQHKMEVKEKTHLMLEASLPQYSSVPSSL